MSDRGAEFYNNISQNFLRSKNIQHFSPFTDQGPSITERVIKTLCNFSNKARIRERKR